jgi:hypothetical protein
MLDIKLRDGLLMLGAAAVSALATMVSVRWLDGTLIDWHTTAECAGHFATFVGVIVAGGWAGYLAWRRGTLVGRAEIMHKHQMWSDSSGQILRVFIELHNPSESVMRPGDGMTLVQTPPITPFLSSDYSYERWESIAKIRHPSTYEEIHIDPKEREVFVHDIRVPAGVRFVQIHSWLRCEITDKPLCDTDKPGLRPLGAIEVPREADTWSKTTLIDLMDTVAPSPIT